MAEQMRTTYANATELLARFGATLGDVVEEVVYVSRHGSRCLASSWRSVSRSS
jgi:hypothetical protein